MKDCPYCNCGWIDADPPSSYGYRCPDCHGTGKIREEGIDFWLCPICGEEMEYDAEMCNSCEMHMEEEASTELNTFTTA